MVLLVAAIPVLVVTGMRVVLDSNDGRLVNPVTDPAAPGWEAIVDPTPTNLVMTVDAANALQDVAVMVLTGDGSGAVLQIPVDTLFQVGDVEVTLAFAWATGGEVSVRDGVGMLLDLAMADAQVVTADQWAALVAPVAPLTVNSPDPALDASNQVVFPRGSIQVPADRVATYLGTQGRSESELARMVRVEAFWRAWLAATAAAGPTSVPPPSDVGLGNFLSRLGAGSVQFRTLPVTVAVPGPSPIYRADPAVVAAIVAELVPFPQGPAGSRATTKVLDGTGRLDHGIEAAVTVGAAGGQVQVVGNASEFGVATTRIIYFDEARRADAERIAQALGVGEVDRSEATSAFDIEVVLGDDAVGAPGVGDAVPSAVGDGPGSGDRDG